MDIEQIIVDIKQYFHDEFGHNQFIMYGSFVDYKNRFFVEPKDIDIMLIDFHDTNEKFNITIPHVPLQLEITPMYSADILKEVKNLEPKYFNFYTPAIGYQSMIYNELDNQRTWEVRSKISSISSKAYNKGKKKLILESDYNEYLGLKNIYHAFKFVIDAMYYYDSYISSIKSQAIMKYNKIWYLKDTYDIIFNTYYSSTGTLEERWKKLDAVIKPRYNKLMSEFRIRFPKRSTNE